MLAIGDAVWDIRDSLEYEQSRSETSAIATGNG
jgi:hypothetical protein